MLPDFWVGGDRHGWLAEFCSRLELMLHGRDADTLSGRRLPPHPVAVVLLPMWLWGKPAIDVGRKDQSKVTSGRLLMPIRLHWFTGRDRPMTSVQLLDEGEHVLRWRTVGLGVQSAGQVIVTVTGGGVTVPVPCPPGQLPGNLHTGTVFDVGATLGQLARTGAETKFELLADGASFSLAPWVDAELHKAHLHLAKSAAALSGGSPDEVLPPLMGPAGFEECRTAMLFGKPRTRPLRAGVHPVWDERDISPRVPRLLDQCLDLDFARFDPLLYVSRAIHRDAQETVKRYVGDCPEGVRIRATALEAGLVVRSVHDELVDRVLHLFRARFPNVGTNSEHVRAALSLADTERRHSLPHVREFDELRQPMRAGGPHVL